MKSNLSWIFFLIVITAAFSINIPTTNASSNNLFQTSGGSTTSTSGAPAAPAITVYVIVDGPGAGTQLSSTVDAATGMIIADAMGNPAVNADGHIGGVGVGEGMNCPGPLGHYHGTLRGQPDPDPEKCGWGHVSEFKDTSDGTMGISNSFMKEVDIIRRIEMDPPDYDGAGDIALDLFVNLEAAKRDIRDPSKTMIGPGQAMAINEKLNKAIKDDKSVLMALTNPVPTKRDTDKDALINLKINAALMLKQDALMILQEAEAMAAAMGAMGE